MEQQNDLADVLAAEPQGSDVPVAETVVADADGVAAPDAPAHAAAAPAPDDAPAQDEARPVPAAWSDEEQRLNERLNMSEAMLREQHGDADVDAKLAAFRREAQRDPGLRAALRQQAHPWAWMYRQAQRTLAVEEIGADPDAYRSRVREEVRAELAEAESGAASGAASGAPRAASAPPRAPSLAAGRSSAPRGVAWSGPSALDDILRR